MQPPNFSNLPAEKWKFQISATPEIQAKQKKMENARRIWKWNSNKQQKAEFRENDQTVECVPALGH